MESVFYCHPLSCSQRTLGGRHACPTVSAYLAAGYLLYTGRITADSLVKWMQLACNDYCAAHPVDEGVDPVDRVPRDFDTPLTALKRHKALSMAAVVDADLECSGLMLQDQSLLNGMPEQVREECKEGRLLWGLEPAMQKLQDAVLGDMSIPLDAPDPLQPVRGFVFSRGDHIISGSVRRTRDGKARFDLVDSHDCLYPGLMGPEARHRCAIWCTCVGLPTMLQTMHQIYPVDTVGRVKDYERHSADLELPCQYNVLVFRRRHRTQQEAIQSYKRNTTPYLSPVY